jgi:hypothetical protein
MTNSRGQVKDIKDEQDKPPVYPSSCRSLRGEAPQAVVERV